MIFTGMQSQDRASAQVGVLLAEMLGIPAATTVVEFAFDEGTITATVTLNGFCLTAKVRKGLLSQSEALSLPSLISSGLRGGFFTESKNIAEFLVSGCKGSTVLPLFDRPHVVIERNADAISFAGYRCSRYGG